MKIFIVDFFAATGHVFGGAEFVSWAPVTHFYKFAYFQLKHAKQ